MQVWNGNCVSDDFVKTKTKKLVAFFLFTECCVNYCCDLRSLRTDKSVIIGKRHERFVVYFDGISSLGNVADKATARVLNTFQNLLS